MKFSLALAVTGASAIVMKKGGMAVKSQTASLAAAKTKEMSRYMEQVRNEVAAAAEAKGQAYAEYLPDEDDEEGMTYGENGYEKDLIDDNPRIGVHQFLEDQEDAPEPEAYEGEDTAQIDADDEATHFGEDAPEDDGALETGSDHAEGEEDFDEAQE
jgi:hypothetical protein